ncbi:ABC transporter ATP-binding protein, partial [Alphaproteobacteria bacterium]|nr:ABC transporter ATP-binding protein [Alphaproteobacteria bacterium]
LTTHYLEEAETLCDHVAIINQGTLITSKPKAELMAGASRKELHMTIANNTGTALPEALKNLGAKWGNGKLSVLYDPKQINAATIITTVTKAGMEVEEVSTIEPDLEDVFLELTNSDTPPT